MMMKIQKNLLFILILLLILIILLILNLLSFNKINFSSSLFNNIVTPIAALIGIYFYSRALNVSQEQNKLLLSQNLKDNYLKEIDMLIHDSQETLVLGMNSVFTGFKLKDIKGVKFYDEYIKLISDLRKDKDFIIDNRKFRRKEFIEEVDYFETRTYSEYSLYFVPFIYGTSEYFKLINSALDLLKVISLSKMNNQDKLILFNILYSKILVDYLQLYNLESNLFKEAYIPDQFTTDRATFRKLFETKFGYYLEDVLKYDEIRRELAIFK